MAIKTYMNISKTKDMGWGDSSEGWSTYFAYVGPDLIPEVI